MTSVYGVTYIGAKKQIQEKIEEKVSQQCLFAQKRWFKFSQDSNFAIL